MISTENIKTEFSMEEEGEEEEEEREEGQLSPAHRRLGPVQDTPEDLSVKKKSSFISHPSSSHPSSPPSSSHQSSHPSSQPTEDSRSSSSPGSQGSGGEVSRPKRIKPIPPPLDLNARTLSPSDTLPQPIPRSPADLPRECLPIRKRAFLSVKEENTRSSLLYPHPSSASSLIPSSISLTPSSGSSCVNFTHFPVPPLIPVPGICSPYHQKSPFLNSTNGFPTPPTDLHSPGYPWHSPTLTAMGLLPGFSPLPHSPLPFPTSSLLSPSPSYHSSSNSSREELPTSHHLSLSVSESKPTLSAPTPRYAHLNMSDRGHSPAPSSPLLSPMARSHSWPIPVWQCFLQGVQVRFLLPSTDTPWQRSEELGWKDRLALKVDSRNPYQYAPNGLTLLKMELAPSDTSIAVDAKPVLRLRMSPNNVPDVSKVEMLAECPLEHPFFVKDKGWCSAHPRATLDKYGIPCQDLNSGDVCLPPNHPEAVRTPDLCDRFKRFEFSSQDLADQFSPGGPRGTNHLRHGIASLLPSARGGMMSPPMSPMKKKVHDPDKPKRPMNGFMLFAKKFRLELIQQHPGKDNRAISVLLGEAWKGLALEERELYSQRAKVLADEQKKIHPDCWKRKRSLNNSQPSAAGQHSNNHSPNHPLPHSPHGHNVPQSPGGLSHTVPHSPNLLGHSIHGTPTSLHHHISFPYPHHTFSPLTLGQPVSLHPS